MRIAFILNTLSIGGAERLVVSLADRMQARGHSVHIFTLLPASPEQFRTSVEVTYLDVDRNLLSVMRAFARARGLLRQFKPDVVHSHNFHGNLFARGLKLANPRLRVLSTLHNEYEGGRARMLALRLTDPLSIRTVAVSEAVAERAFELSVMPRRKCEVITNGIDVEQFKPDRERRTEMRAAQWARDNFVWLSAGRITPAKDYPTLLRAFAQVHAAVPHTRLWIAGDGDEAYAQTLHMTAQQCGIGGAVEWLGMRRDMAALLDAADGFVLSSAWEGMPLALVEAMAMEKAVVATGVGGVSELTEHCALVVPPRDPNALARAMLSILNTPLEARAFLGCAARQRVAEKFNIDIKAAEWEAVYRQTANQ